MKKFYFLKLKKRTFFEKVKLIDLNFLQVSKNLQLLRKLGSANRKLLFLTAFLNRKVYPSTTVGGGGVGEK